MADATSTVNNQDVVGLYNRINDFIFEMFKSVSSQTSEMNEFDQARLTTYLDAVDTYHGWVTNQPHLDLPETSPRAYPLRAPDDVPIVENENVNDITRMMVIARDELINSQSARLAAGLNKFDSARLTAMIEKLRRFLSDYVGVATPLDVPESSPGMVSSGAGRTGI